MQLNSRTIVIGIIIVIVAIFVLPRLFNTDNVDNTPADDSAGSQTVDENIDLGRVVSASSIDRDGCATDTTASFEVTEPVYVVAEDSNVPRGTSVFVRLYHEGQPVEDAPEITADQDYNNTCINFIFEPEGSAFDPGSYEAEFIINGNPADSVSFEIR
ncbi:MAG: hypothetical protein L0154_14115 [Chloroflexi bacterium]|nr:hypothetical protein [Chloroflexota bacterium]